MFPIQEQGHHKGIGHGYDSFLRKFIEICENHLENGRAKSFAFILQELYTTIENYLKNSKNLPKPKRNKLTNFFGNVKKITVEEFIKWVIEQGLEKARNIY